MPDDRTPQPFFVIAADHDRGFFTVEGAMTDDRPWQAAIRLPAKSQAGRGAAGKHREAGPITDQFHAPVLHGLVKPNGTGGNIVSRGITGKTGGA